MKRTCCAAVAAAALIYQAVVLPQYSASASASEAPAQIEGKLANGRVLIPLRAFAEHLDAKVKWDNQEKYATMKFDDKEIGIGLNGTEVGIDGILTGLTLDVPMTMFDNTTYLPFSFIGSVIGADVSWNNQSKQATVVYKGQTLLINAMADPKIQLPTKPTQQRVAQLYAKVGEAANITKYAQKRQQLSGYFTEALISRVIKNKGLSEFDKRYADQFEEPTLQYSNASMYGAVLFQSMFSRSDGELFRNIVLKFENGKWLVDDVMTHIVELRP